MCQRVIKRIFTSNQCYINILIISNRPSIVPLQQHQFNFLLHILYVTCNKLDKTLRLLHILFCFVLYCFVSVRLIYIPCLPDQIFIELDVDSLNHKINIFSGPPLIALFLFHYRVKYYS